MNTCSFSFVGMLMLTPVCYADFIDFESIPGINQPYSDTPFGATPLTTQLQSSGIRFGISGLPSNVSNPAVLRFNPELAPFGAFGPPRSGNGALYAFPGALTSARPDVFMAASIAFSFSTPASHTSFWMLVSPNGNSPVNNIGVTFFTADQTRVDLAFFNISTTNWFQITLNSPNASGISSVNLASFNGGLISQRPYALDDLSFTPIPTPAVTPLFLAAAAFLPRRRRA